MNKNNLKSVIISVFFSELTALFLLLAFALLTYNKPDPSVYSSKLGVASLLIGGLACGIISTLITKKKSISLSLISGGAYCALQLLSTLIFSDEKFDFTFVIVKLILTLGICFLVSYLMINKNSKHKKHRRKLKNR